MRKKTIERVARRGSTAWLAAVLLLVLAAHDSRAHIPRQAPHLQPAPTPQPALQQDSSRQTSSALQSPYHSQQKQQLMERYEARFRHLDSLLFGPPPTRQQASAATTPLPDSAQTLASAQPPAPTPAASAQTAPAAAQTVPASAQTAHASDYARTPAHEHARDTAPETAETLHTQPFLPERDEELERALAAHERASLAAANAATGLQLSGDAYYRFNGDQWSVQEDLGEPTQYDMKYSATLTWNLLQSGLLNRGIRADIASLERQQASLTAHQPLIRAALDQMREQVTMKYDTLLAGILALHVANLQLLEETESLLLASGQTTSDSMLRLLEERATAERALAAIGSDIPRTPRLHAATAWRPMQIDAAALVDCYRTTNDALHMYELQSNLLAQQQRQQSYWQQVGLGPYVRYAIYARKEGWTRQNIDAGLTLRLPLSNESGRKRRALRAEQQVVQAEQAQAARIGEEAILRLVDRCNALTQAIASEQTRMTGYMDLLRQRRHATRQMQGTYSRPSRLREYNGYLTALERFLTLRRDQELLIVDLQGYLPETDVARFITPSGR